MNNRKLTLILISIFYITVAGLCIPISYMDAQTVSAPSATNSTTPAYSEEATSEELVSEESTSEELASEESTLEVAPTSEDNMLENEAKQNQFPIPFICSITNRVNIRNSPSMAASIIGKIPPGQSGEILEIVDEEWAKVRYLDTTGYASYRYFKFTLPDSDSVEIPALNSEAVLETEIEAETEVEADQSGVISIVEACYIRSSPEVNASQNIVRTASKGHTYPHVAENDTPYFYAIRLADNSVAYVSVIYTEKKEETN